MAQLYIQVNEQFSLDAGSVVEQADGYVITPPRKPLIDQLIDYLDAQPDASVDSVVTSLRYLGIGFTALCVRWGSYLATLMDTNAPLHPDIPGDHKLQPEHTSFITDSEMKRLNIEISYNIDRLAQVYQERGQEACDSLLAKAYIALPMPHKRTKLNRKVAEQIFICVALGNEHVELYERGESSGPFTFFNEDGTAYSSIRRVSPNDARRYLANKVACQAWRNTIIEDIHAGTSPDHLLQPHQRRFSQRDMLAVMREMSGNFTDVMLMTGMLFDEQFKYQDLPAYPRTATAIANSYMGMCAEDWSLVDHSSEVRLYK